MDWNMDTGDKCYLANLSVIALGTIGTLALTACFAPWRWWWNLLLLPVIFIGWHLLVERCLSRYVNRLIEGKNSDSSQDHSSK